MAHDNLAFLSPRKSRQVTGAVKLRRGMMVQEVMDGQGDTFQAVVLGSLFNKKPGEKSKAVPVAAENGPRIRGDFAMAGSIVTLPDGGIELGAYKRDGVWLPVLRTGLLVQHAGTQEDLQALRKEAKKGAVRIRPHGTISLHNTASRLLAEGLSADMAQIPAEEIFTEDFGKIRGMEMPRYRFAMWGIPVGSAVLTQDIDGTLILLEGQEDRLELHDLTGEAKYAEIFAEHYAAVEAAKKAAR